MSKRILVTGASKGIGRGAAIALARRGHRVVLAARSAPALEEVAATIAAAGGAAEVLPMDVTDDESVERAVASMLERGPCDVAVNNAGICHQGEFLAQPRALAREEMELNYFGAQRVARAVLPAMIAQRRGHLVNVSSLVGIIPSPTTTTYSASKAALNAWSHALRGEVERFGVRVTVFVAPHTQTELGARTRFDGVPSLPIEYTVAELLRAIERAPRQYAASPVYRAFIRLAGWFPSFMERQVAGSTRSLLALTDPAARASPSLADP